MQWEEGDQQRRRTRPQAWGNLAAADSLAVDPHKWLAVPMGCGVLFVRDGKVLERAIPFRLNYLLPLVERHANTF